MQNGTVMGVEYWTGHGLCTRVPHTMNTRMPWPQACMEKQLTDVFVHSITVDVTMFQV